MKRLIILTLTLFLFIITATLAAAGVEGIYSVNFTWLNVRSGPGLSHELVDKLNQNEKVKVMGAKQTEWYKIKYRDGKTGYVHKKYLVRITEAIEKNAEPPEGGSTETPEKKIPDESVNMENIEFPEDIEIPENIKLPELIKDEAILKADKPLEEITSIEEVLSTDEISNAEGEIVEDIFEGNEKLMGMKKAFSVKQENHEYIVDYDWLNIRSGPGLFYDKIAELKRGEMIIVEKIVENQWAEIPVKGGKGYVYIKHLERKEKKEIKELLEFVRKVVDLPFFR